MYTTKTLANVFQQPVTEDGTVWRRMGLQALVMDTAALSKQSKSLDGQLATIKHLSEGTQGQLVRASWVFSNALGIPSPLADTAVER